MEVDVVFLVPTGMEPVWDAVRALDHQSPSVLRVYRSHCDPPGPGEHRISAIVRNRNSIKAQRHLVAPYLFTLDSDVVIPPGCLNELARALWEDETLAGLAVDYRREDDGTDTPAHIGMGAVLWRKRHFDRIIFRFDPTILKGPCECMNAVADVRAMGLEIRYLHGLCAVHVREQFDRGKNFTSRQAYERSISTSGEPERAEGPSNAESGCAPPKGPRKKRK